jgi:hypothetical protein
MTSCLLRQLQALENGGSGDGDADRGQGEAIAAAATPEERQAMKEAPLEEHRSTFGLSVLEERVLPKVYQEEYDREYSGLESDFLLAAREPSRPRGARSPTRRGARCRRGSQGG